MIAATADYNTDGSIWHTNADEPSVLDYNTEFKSTGQVISLYTADEYRSSDHDPVIADLELRTERIYLPVVMRGYPEPGVRQSFARQAK